MKNMIKIKFINFLIIMLLILFSCKKHDQGYYKVANFFIFQNLTDTSGNSAFKFDTIYWSVVSSTEWARLNETSSIPPSPMDSEGNITAIDYYKSITTNIVHDYNDTLTSGKIANEILGIKYYQRCFYWMGFTDTIECYESTAIQFDNIDQFLSSVDCPRAHPFDFYLNIPPDTTRLFQIKINIELLDGRNFELYSEPVYIEP